MVTCTRSCVHTQYNDLLKKKKIVENDKAKIAELIAELDQKKNEALQGAYERVNKVCVVMWYVVEEGREGGRLKEGGRNWVHNNCGYPTET